MKKLLLIPFLLMVIGCTDATKADLFSYGKEHTITMYNGGKLVKQWTSTGKVNSMSDSDGWQFMDKETGKLVRVGGDIIIEVLN